MPLDDLALSAQRLLDQLIRRLRLGGAPRAGARRLLIVQIDGLSRGVLEEGLAAGHAPLLRGLLAEGTPTPLTHPVQLYPYFLGHQTGRAA